MGSLQGSSTGSKIAFLDPYSLNLNDDLSTPAGQANFAMSIDRVGVDQKDLINGIYQFDKNDLNDNGILEYNTFKTHSQTKGVVHVGVYVARLYYSGSTVTSFVGAGAMNVTFQVLSSASLTPLYWDQFGASNISISSNSTNSIAQVTFTYMPFYPNKAGFVTLHGTSPLIFTAIPGYNQTVDSSTCAGLTCTYAFSDTNRNDDSYNINNGNTSISSNGITYDPFQVIPNSGAPYDLMTINTNIEPLIHVNNKIVNTLPGINKIFLEMNSNNLFVNIILQSPQENFFSSSVLYTISICLIRAMIS